MKKLTFFVYVLISSLLVTSMLPADAAVVFADDFSSGNFNRWSQSKVIEGASQIIKDGVACFTVPPPMSETCSYSFVVKDGFFSTAKSILVAQQDVWVSLVPNGASQGNSAIFFFYVCDSTNLNGNYGNFGVGIDGSSVWSLWIGGVSVYRYVFQTEGPPPASNTWYHLVLTINNIEQTVSLEVDGVVVISASQQQFTDKTHPISLMAGMGEDWWCNGPGLELKLDNVQLDISDSSSLNMPAPTSMPTSRPQTHSNSNPMPLQSPLPSPTQRLTPTPTVVTPRLTPSPAHINSTPTLTPAKSPDVTLDLALLPVTILAVLIVMAASVMLLKFYRIKN